MIAAPVWARDAGEADRLHAALRSLAQHRLPVVLADGGSEESFLGRLADLPHVQLAPARPTPAPRLLGQIQRALAQASTLGPRHVLYTEPDKQWFFENRLADFVAQATHTNPAGVVLAARDTSSFATFPPFQRATESLFNQLCLEALGLEGDFLYGPFLISDALLPHLARIEEDLGWGWRPFVIAVAHRLGLPVSFVVADLPCAREQRGEDDSQSRLYRLDQLAQNVKGLAHGMRYSLEPV